jgi:uncharacterized protein with von Willebrand factor type A (vWA) domain
MSAVALPPYDLTDSLVGLGRTLRHAGVQASADRVEAAVRAVEALDRTQYDQVYWACRLAFCSGPDDLPRFDRVFEAWFGDRPRQVARQQRIQVRKVQAVAEAGGEGELEEREGGEAADVPAASTLEQLRERDVGRLTPQEREQLRRLLARLSLAGEPRASRRRRASARGPVDPGRTLRDVLRTGGEPARLRHRRPTVRARRVVLLVDVSGSMDVYADALLRFAHAATRRGAPTEVFALGTRLTRLTRELSVREPDAAMAAVAEALPDAGGGTRLGDLLKEFLDRWGQRGTARGAVVVVLSDGWERGDATLLGEQMARLQRFAHRVVWSNPRKAAPGYAPLAAGMAAALPSVDDFVEGHSLAALEHLADVVLGRARAVAHQSPTARRPDRA